MNVKTEDRLAKFAFGILFGGGGTVVIGCLVVVFWALNEVL